MSRCFRQEESNFAARMYTYNYRIYDRYKKSVASLAVLGDDSESWRPNQFGYQLFGCTVDFRFPVIKLLDYEQRQSELEVSSNPFAIIVMAHLAALETSSDRPERKRQKLTLVKRLYDLKFKREDIISLFKFLDWMMTLPLNLEGEFWQEYRNFEESRRMQYVTSVERLGIRQGLLKGIASSLKLKFGSESQNLLPEIETIQDVSILEAILSAIETANTVEELRSIYQPATE